MMPPGVAGISASASGWASGSASGSASGWASASASGWAFRSGGAWDPPAAHSLSRSLEPE